LTADGQRDLFGVYSDDFAPETFLVALHDVDLLFRAERNHVGPGALSG
jgi:hypothetical protein